MLNLIKALLAGKNKTSKKSPQRRRRESIQLDVELLETRVMPVIGSTVQAAIVPPGTNLDGVVLLRNASGLGSGEELASQTQILTAWHVAPNPGQATTITWNLQRNNNPVNITLTEPANAGGGMAANYNYSPGPNAAGVNDIALLNLRDTLPLAPVPAGNNLQLVAPFSPFENGYPIMNPGALNPAWIPAGPGIPGGPGPGYLRQLISIVGYGRQGFGTGVGVNGVNQRSQPVGTKTVGMNELERYQAGSNQTVDQYDFDGGGLNPFGSPGLANNNATPWSNESNSAQGDSGGPLLVGTVGNGNGPVQGTGAGNTLRIVGETTTGPVAFGAIANNGNPFAYNNPPVAAAGGNPAVPAGFIWTAQNAQYGVILDMRDQVLGNTTNVAGATQQDPLTITAYRGLLNGNPQANGPNLLIRVTDTSPGVPAAFQYNGIYFNQPINNTAGTALLTQGLTLVGNNGNDTFQIMGNLGVGPITIQGGATNNTVAYQDAANIASTYAVTGAAAGGGNPAITTLTVTPNGGAAFAITASQISTLNVAGPNGANTIFQVTGNPQLSNVSQTIMVPASPAPGAGATFQLQYAVPGGNVVTTPAIPVGANAGAVQAALNQAVNPAAPAVTPLAGNVVVSGTPGNWNVQLQNSVQTIVPPAVLVGANFGSGLGLC